MQIKNRDTGAALPRAELVLEGQEDVEKLRRALDAYERQCGGHDGSFRDSGSASE
jgi:hypothetical protein